MPPYPSTSTLSPVKDATWKIKVELLDKDQVLQHPTDMATLITCKASKRGQTNMLYADLDLDTMQDQGRRHATRFRICLEPLEEQITTFQTAGPETHTLEVMVVDHHFPSATIQSVVRSHLNVYYVGGDYNICSGMLGVELARFIDPNVSDSIIHIPAIAGFGDRVEGSELNQYLELAKEKNYTESLLTDIAIAVDYQAYFLKFSPGRLLLSDLLGIQGIDERQLAFVKLLATEARNHLEKQLEISLEYSQQETLPNGLNLAFLDVEKYANRFDYPPPGKITGSLFDHLAAQSPDPLVTIGLGPDFAIFRSQYCNLDFPNLVKTLSKKMPHANIEGGGHEIVGSLKFISGAREEFIELIKEQLTLITIEPSKH